MPRAPLPAAARRPRPRTRRRRARDVHAAAPTSSRPASRDATEAATRIALTSISRGGPNVRLLFGMVLALVVAAAIGLSGTWLALTQGTAYGGVTIGAWTGWPKNGTPGIDPYARAIVARTGELPIGSGDGVAFYAAPTMPASRSTAAATSC